MRKVIAFSLLMLLLSSCETYGPSLTGTAPTPLPVLDAAAPVLPTRTALPPTIPPATRVPTRTPEPTAEPARQYYEAGVKAFGTGNYGNALLQFTQALQLDPKNALIYLNRAQVYLAQQDYDGAASDFTQVIQLDPKNVAAWVSRAQAQAAQQNFAQAISDLDQAVKLSPAEPSVYVTRGQIIQASGDITQALASFAQALNIDPNYAPAYYYRALAYTADRPAQQLGVDRRVVDDLTAVLALEPWNIDAYMARAEAYVNGGDLDKALADYNLAVVVTPDNLDPLLKRGHLQYVRRDYKSALDDFNKALEIEPNSIAALRERGLVYIEQTQYDKAIADFSAMLKIDPQNIDALIRTRARLREADSIEMRRLNDLKRALAISQDAGRQSAGAGGDRSVDAIVHALRTTEIPMPKKILLTRRSLTRLSGFLRLAAIRSRWSAAFLDWQR